MTFHEAATVSGRDLRRLLDSELPDPTLVLVQGRIDVVPAANRTGLEVISREQFLRGTDQTEFTDTELD